MTASGSPEDRPGNSGSSGARRALAPTRDSEATLSALVDSLLNKGVYLDLDAIITVAEVPLIGISLRAALASMETLLEYGLMTDWDERTRAWARRSAPPGVGLREQEQVITRMPGSYREERPGSGLWHPGTVYLTSERLLVFRREPETVLWAVELEDIAQVGQVSERSVGGQDAPRIVVTTRAGSTVRLTAARPDDLRELIHRGAGHSSAALADHGPLPRPLPEAGRTVESAQPVARGKTGPDIGEGALHFREARSAGTVWRRGVGRCDSRDGFRWTGDGERRPGVRIGRAELQGVRVEEAEGLPGGTTALIVQTQHGEAWFAGSDVEQWERWLNRLRSEEGDHERAQDR